MKTLAPILCVLLMGGCVRMPDAERLTKLLQDGNPTYRLEIDYRLKTLAISRANPTLGLTASVGTNGAVSSMAPQGSTMQISYHVLSAAPAGVTAQQTTNTNKP